MLEIVGARLHDRVVLQRPFEGEEPGRQGEGLDEDGEGAARGGAHCGRDVVAVVGLR